jgi:hypothetical protein
MISTPQCPPNLPADMKPAKHDKRHRRSLTIAADAWASPAARIGEEEKTFRDEAVKPQQRGPKHATG